MIYCDLLLGLAFQKIQSSWKREQKRILRGLKKKFICEERLNDLGLSNLNRRSLKEHNVGFQLREKQGSKEKEDNPFLCSWGIVSNNRLQLQ